MSFGFGKALDVLRAGDAVKREGWDLGALDGRLRLERAEMLQRSAPGEYVREARFVVTIVTATDQTRERVWFPTHDDLLTEDWDYAR